MFIIFGGLILLTTVGCFVMKMKKNKTTEASFKDISDDKKGQINVPLIDNEIMQMNADSALTPEPRNDSLKSTFIE